MQCFANINTLGHEVDSVGDVNAEGYDDVIIGAWFYGRPSPTPFFLSTVKVPEEVVSLLFPKVVNKGCKYRQPMTLMPD